jgi:hypothetical protein
MPEVLTKMLTWGGEETSHHTLEASPVYALYFVPRSVLIVVVEVILVVTSYPDLSLFV